MTILNHLLNGTLSLPKPRLENKVSALQDRIVLTKPVDPNAGIAIMYYRKPKSCPHCGGEL